MTEQEARIILTLAECSMNVSDTAQRSYVHRNTVLYHIGKIKEKTGLDARNFYQLYELTRRAKETLKQLEKRRGLTARLKEEKP